MVKWFNGIAKCIKTLLTLDDRFNMIESRLNSLEKKVDDLYHLLVELLRRY